MEKYYNDYNTVLDEPTPCKPYTEAETEIERGYTCPKTDLVNISHEIKKTLNLYFEYATPEDNYACCLQEGSPILWDVDYVREGKLIKICGVVDKIEFHADKFNGHLYSHSLNGVIPTTEEIVVRFDCSTENSSKVVSVNIAKIRRLKYSEANVTDLKNKTLVLPKDAYGFMNKEYPIVYKTMVTKLDMDIDASKTIVGDYCFSDMVNLKQIEKKLSCPKLITADFMFANCQSLEELTLDEMPNVKTATGIFKGNKSLTIMEINMPKVEDLDLAFKDCTNLKEVKLNDVSNVTTAKDIFKNCNAIKSLDVKANSINFDLEILSPVISDQAINNIINGLKLDRDELEKTTTPRYLTFCDHTLCPANTVAAVINATLKGGWVINGLYTEDKSLENQTPPKETKDESLDIDKEYPDDLIDLYNDITNG